MALPPYELPTNQEEPEDNQITQIYGRIADLVHQAGFKPHATGFYGTEAPQPEYFRYPDRSSGVGTDLYVAMEGDTWASISQRVYGDTSYTSLLMQHNRGTELQPGVRIVLPDHAIDPRSDSGGFEDFWNLPEFDNDVNAMDEQWRIQNMLDAVETIWPEHGEEVFIGWDERGSAYPTSDPNGAPLFWNPETNNIDFNDTGIRYTMGMMENDFIKPLTIEEQRELTLMGENSLRPEAIDYYVEQNRILAEQIELLDFGMRVSEEFPEDSAYLPSVHGDPIATDFGELGLGWRGIDVMSYGEEAIRGAANIVEREAGARTEGLNFLERGMAIVTSAAQTAGNVLANSWHLNREIIVRLFGKDLTPFAIDIKTGTRLNAQEVLYRQNAGLENTIRYINPVKYHQLQADQSQATMIRLLASHLDGHWTGIFPHSFESEEAYEDYLGGIFGAYEEEQQNALMDSLQQHENDFQTRAEAEAEMQNLMDIAFQYHKAGHGDQALDFMERALRLHQMGAKWYSPYFMWTELTHPEQYNQFMRAAAGATLENGELLDESVVRMMRRQYEDAGVDIMMGITLDITNYVPIFGWAKAAVSMPFKLVDLVLPAFRPGAIKAGFKFADWASTTRVGKPISEFMGWLTGRAHASTATMLNQKAVNIFTSAARSVDATLSQPGIKGLDELAESISRVARASDPSLLDDALPSTVQAFQVWNARKLQQIYDNAVQHYARLGEELPPALKALDPDNWGGLVHDAHRLVWNKEYARHLEELKKLQPDLGLARREAMAARYADEIASKPKLVSQQIGNFWEDGYRTLHRTGLGPSTLDDNFLVIVGRKLGLDWVTEGGAFRWVFQNFYRARNFLFEWWLGLRPSWSSINYIDSSGRALISGAGLYDDLGTGARVNAERLLQLDLVRPEFKSTFQRMIISRGESEAVDIAESAVERLLRGRKYRWGFLSVLNDSLTEARIQRQIERALMKATPDNPAAKSINWMADQLQILRRGLTSGARDVNQLMEFGLRQRVFATHYREMAAKFGEHNLDTLLLKMAESGESGPAAQALRKFWEMSDNNASALEQLIRRAVSESPEGPNRQLVSEILPDNFIGRLEELGVDRRVRATIVYAIVNDVEDILKAAPNAVTAADEVVTYMDNAIRNINDEFVRQIEQIGSQPHRVSPGDVVQPGTRSATEEGAQQINAGAGHAETLTISLTDLKKGGFSGFSQAYQDAGALERISVANLFETRRITLRRLVDEETITPEFASEATVYLDEVYDRLTYFRDKFKDWMLHIFPGPLRQPFGALRREAFDAVDRIGTQVYYSLIHFADEAVENVLVRNAVDELPSIENLLLRSGIELSWDGTKLASIRVTDAVAGTRSSLTGWRSTNYMKGELMSRFFGPNATFREARVFFNSPYTTSLWEESRRVLTPEEVAAQAASHPGIGEAVDRGIREADAAWQAWIRNPDMGAGRSLLEIWGWSAVKNRETFIASLDNAIARQSALVGIWEELRGTGISNQAVDEGIQAIVDSTDLIRQWQAEVLQIGRTIDSITSPYKFLDLGLETGPINVPRWLLDDGIQTYLNMQRGLAAQHHGVITALEELKEYLSAGLRDGSVSLTASKLTRSQLQQLADVADEAVWRMATGSTIASDGSKAVRTAASEIDAPVPDAVGKIDNMLKSVTGGDDYRGAVAITQDDMLEYADNTVFDNNMKFISPFWMFQSRSPLFWMRTFAQHPEYMAWVSRFYRQSRRSQINNGAVSTSGAPLSRFFGYFRVPGTSMWVALLNPLSMRYVIPQDPPYPSEFGEDYSARDVAINYAYEFGRMYGFNPAPWITYPLYVARVLNPDRHPVARFPISHVDLIPPWWQREMLRFMRIQQYPNDPGLFNPDVGWKDFLVEREILGWAAQELEKNPDNWAAIQAEIMEALGFGELELDENGVPRPFEQQILTPHREHPRWIEARALVENTTWRNQWVGFITGIYPKDMSDGEAAMIQVRQEINFLKDSINSAIGHVLFNLDPVEETRSEFYRDKKFETPEGWLDQLYGTIRWIELPGGGQAYGEPRHELMAQRIWENEVTAAYYDSLELIQQEFDQCQSALMIGSDSALERACYANRFEAQAAIDNEPVFDAARRNWMIGYQTDSQILDRFEHMWWRGYILPTKPKWYIEDGETYDSWMERVERWEEDLPMLAEELAAVFLARTVMPATGDPESQTDLPTIPDNRVLIPENVINNLKSITNADGYTAYNLENDSIFDALNAAWKALRWDPYMEATRSWEDLNEYERDLANQAFMDKHGDPPTVDELSRWVMENYPDRWSVEELVKEYKGHGAETLEHRMLPENRLALITSEVWDMLSAVGPGENFKVFKEALILAGFDQDMLTAWYESNGTMPAEFTQELHDAISAISGQVQLKPPSTAQLVEWASAKNINDQFREDVMGTLGRNIFNLIGTYGALTGQAKKDFRKKYDDLIERYYDMRDFFADENQLWAKYYHIDRYKGGMGLPGEGAEKRSSYGEDIKKGSSGVRPGWSGGGGGGGRTAGESFIPQGYRSTYTVQELFDPQKLGSGGMADVPYWPPGYGRGKPPELLTEIVKLIGKQQPLSDAAVEYMERQKTWKEYHEKVLKYNAEVTNRQHQRGKGLDTDIFSR